MFNVTTLKRVKISMFSILSCAFPVDCAVATESTNHVIEVQENPYRTKSFVAFESGPVRPLAITPDKKRIISVNTPDNRIEIFDIGDTSLKPVYSVKVGMEPVAVAAYSNNEIWVVNHLSDSVSVVKLSEDYGHVAATLNVGDEPRDIVFAGKDKKYAYITVAHRGQSAPFDPKLTTEGIGRADIWVYDPQTITTESNPEPEHIINLFSDTPRALAVSPDGRFVYAAAFHSGNKTTVLYADVLRGGLDKPPPVSDAVQSPEPVTGLIVKYDGENWLDNGYPRFGVSGKKWNDRVNFTLPDNDVFVIDTAPSTPVISKEISGVGTTLFNMAVNPKDGSLYVSNTDALNHVRYASNAKYGPNLKGRFIKNQITIIDGDNVLARDLNKHIKTAHLDHGTEAEAKDSLAIPLEMVVSQDGKTLYVAAYGSQTVGVFDIEKLRNGTFEPDNDNYINVSGGGPAGLLLDDAANKLYVYTRFDNSVSVINLKDKSELDKQRLFNPEPQNLIEGREFLYNARISSSRGDIACASCHVFGDSDQLAWDLGNPNGISLHNPNAYHSDGVEAEKRPFFHPMKGPMFTQSLRGLWGNGPMHWRGDKTGVTRDADETLEEQAFEDFNEAFVNVQGAKSELPEEQMQKFAEFALQLIYPPNPIRNLDNSLTDSQHLGSDIFTSDNEGILVGCNSCHELDATKKRYGTQGLMNIAEPLQGRFEDFKIPHLRAMYSKVGKFGYTGSPEQGAPKLGDQVRGFGFNHDGASSSMHELLEEPIFEFPTREDLEAVIDFIFVINGELSPIVGQQVTLNKRNYQEIEVQARLKLMYERSLIKAPLPECDLIVSGIMAEKPFDAYFAGDKAVQVDAEQSEFSLADLQKKVAKGQTTLTFTCVPPDSGVRMGESRRFENGLELQASNRQR